MNSVDSGSVNSNLMVCESFAFDSALVMLPEKSTNILARFQRIFWNFLNAGSRSEIVGFWELVDVFERVSRRQFVSTAALSMAWFPP